MRRGRAWCGARCPLAATQN
ncbi:MAG: hypothetical protein ACK4XJ_04495 [Fimbriimonadaceae bacterium]